MSIQLYKMTFRHAHFGEGRLNESEASFDASRLYSALFLEAMKLGKEDDFLSLSLETSFVLSDAFPFINGEPFLPKPVGYPSYKEAPVKNLKETRQTAKKVKKMNYIPFSQMDAFLEHRADIDSLASQRHSFETHGSVTKKGEDPYEVGVTAFKDSLYILASESKLFDTLMDSLQYSGLGGKRTSGYGQFSLEKKSLPQEFSERIDRKPQGTAILLTTSIPKEDELETSMKGAYYILKKASGFAYSETAGELLRKQDLYKFKAGSTFKQPFEGSIVDVRPDNFPHPVWNYSKGLFYQLKK